MSRLIVVIMQQDQYPFGQCDNTLLDKKKVMVRKIVQFHPFQRKNILLKAKKIKSFINPHLIKLQQLLEEDSSLHLLFEYVPIKIQTWISNINSEFIESFRAQLLELADYLAENSIVIDFKLKNIGMDQSYRPKYFIGLDYEINTTNGKDLLMQKYKAQICDLLNPYQLSQDSQKIKSLKDVNPQSSKKDETLKKINQKSVKETHLKKYILSPSLQTKNEQINSQRNSFTKSGTLNQSDMKLTFDGTHRNLFENLPQKISTNIKIQNIGKKINDLRNLVRNIGDKKKDRKKDSVSLSPGKGSHEQKPTNGYRKSRQIHAVSIVDFGSKQQEKVQNKNKNNEVKQFRQTQSESEYCQNKDEKTKHLDRGNEKRELNRNEQNRLKNQVRVNYNAGKRSYIYQFEKLLDDDIDSFASVEALVRNEVNQNQKVQDINNLCVQQKSPRFGFVSMPVEIPCINTEPQRYSYSHSSKQQRKKSTQSLASNTSQIQQRVNAVIGASRKLISTFRKPKPSEKIGAY